MSEDILAKFVADLPDFSGHEYERISFFMDKGNEIRERTRDAAVLIKGVAAFIFDNYRIDNEGPPPRNAYIINSIKHPDEVELDQKMRVMVNIYFVQSGVVNRVLFLKP